MCDISLSALTLIDMSHDAILVWYYDGPIVFWNRGAQMLYGYEASEAVGRVSHDLLATIHPEGTSAFLRHLRDHREWSGELHHTTKDGRVRVVEARMVLSEEPDGRQIVLETNRDVTERLAGVRTLRESKDRLQIALEAGGMGLWDWDMTTGTVVWSEDHARLFGIDPATFDGRYETFERQVHPDDLAGLDEAIGAAREGDGNYQHEYRVLWPDGAVRWLRGQGRFFYAERDGRRSPTRMVGVLQDVTAQRETQAALERSAERLRQALRAARMGTWELDLSNGNLRLSRENTAVFGVDEAALPRDEAAFFALVHPDDRQTIREQVHGAIDGRHPYMVRFRTVTANGEVRWILSEGAPVYEGDRAVAFAGIKMDVTERHQLEAQLNQAQKMEGIGRLAGGVAHDFNNLLTAILGYVELMRDELPAADPLRNNLEQIDRAASRASDLTRQLLAFARRQIIEPKIVNLNTMVHGLERMLGRLIGEDVEVRTHLAAELGDTRVDPGQMEQVVVNLAVNARDAMPVGGVLTIETANVTLDESYARQHAEVTPGDYVCLSMTDTGGGMTAEVMAKIFEPFFTTKEAGKGTGLGLATVYGVVRQNGGHIWVYSEVGKGTTFKVYLPRVTQTERVAAVAAKTGPSPRGNETILLVEDEPLIRELAAQALSMQGYTVIAATDGREAVEMARAHPGDIHLLITDVVLPGMSGRAVAELLANIKPGLIVLYVSGYTENTIVHHGVLDEGVAFLAKPFTPSVLLRKVRNVLDGLR